MSYRFPDPRPQDDAEFTTSQDKKAFVEAVCIGVQLSMSRNAVSADQIDLAFAVKKGHTAIVVNEHGQPDREPSDVGGMEVIYTGSLNGGARDITFKALHMAGFSFDKAAFAYSKDPEALSLRQQAKAVGKSDVEIAHAAGWLAIKRGDLAACGLGSQPVRLVVLNDTFTPSRGEPITRRRCKYVNAVPRAAETSDLLGLLSGPTTKAPGQIQPPSRATSAPPSGNGKPDDIDF